MTETKKDRESGLFWCGEPVYGFKSVNVNEKVSQSLTKF